VLAVVLASDIIYLALCHSTLNIEKALGTAVNPRGHGRRLRLRWNTPLRLNCRKVDGALRRFRVLDHGATGPGWYRFWDREWMGGVSCLGKYGNAGSAAHHEVRGVESTGRDEECVIRGVQHIVALVLGVGELNRS
jgi:hypothetical protein